MKKSKCILCNGLLKFKISNFVRDSKNHKVLQCSNCNHIQLFPIPSKQDDQFFYDNNLQEKNINLFGNIKDFRKKSIDDVNRRVKLVSKITPKNGKILEIGSGYGFFLEKIKKKGFDVIGIEVSKERRKISKKVTKTKILDVNIMENNWELGKFHTIVLFHVLEHISDLQSFLKNIKKMIYKNGTVVIEVPNFNDYQIKINQSYKNWNLQRAHIHYFSPKLLNSTLKKNGFLNVEIFGVQRYGLGNMINWKINKKPQLESPMYRFDKEYELIEVNYKEFLEKNLISDTLIAIAK